MNFLWLVPALPLAGFVILVLGQRWMSRGVVAWVGVGSVGLAALTALLVGLDFLHTLPPGHVFVLPLWHWITVGTFTPSAGLYLDNLSLVMMWIVSGVGFLIHLYSSEFMVDDPSYTRFFAYMNFFVAAMLVLVLADDLLFLYVGWEGVGLASYLLIGFWYQDPANVIAARKAFVITRAGDTAFFIGLLLLWVNLGTLDIQALMQRAIQSWPVGSGLAVAASALLLGGALGKSAQLPLQTWLPDAMAGPTPVSALIHAATMVTAGVYLIARNHVLFELAPPVHLAVAIIGALTLLVSAFAALTQRDIKRILAYSTISQIGYMFLALGAGAWSAAIFHLMTHAFFKALLFLSAGSVILAVHHEHDIFKMGGLRRQMPLTFWAFLIGSSALAALPLVTAGFYSKDLILFDEWSFPHGGRWLWAAGLVGAFLTGIYIFRAVFIAFFGEAKATVERRPGWRMAVPLVVLSALAIGGGWIELPPTLGIDMPIFTDFMHEALPPERITTPYATEVTLQIVAALTSVAGVVVAWVLFLAYPRTVRNLQTRPIVAALRRFWFGGGGFDWLYARLVVRPFVWIARINHNDVVDGFYKGVALLSRLIHYLLSRSQTGELRWYAATLAAGVIVVIAIAVFT